MSPADGDGDAAAVFTTTLRSAVPGADPACAIHSRRLGSEMPNAAALAVTLRPWLAPLRAYATANARCSAV